MYLADASSEASTAYRRPRRGRIPPTSIALDDGFDAVTTEAPTEWHNDGEQREYYESINGYENYVNEMERMLRTQDEAKSPAGSRRASLILSPQAPPTPIRHPSTIVSRQATPVITRRSLPQGSMLGSPERRNDINLENVRHVSGRHGEVELVEHRVLEDGPARTISLWRERVAEGSAAASQYEDDGQSVGSHTHRRTASGDSYVRRANGSVKGKDVLRRSYERSEYMVMYQQPPRGAHMAAYMYPSSESGKEVRSMGSRQVPQSPAQNTAHTPPMTPTLRRVSGGRSLNRTEYGVSYLQTPPSSGGTLTNSASPKSPQAQNRPASPLTTRVLVPQSTNASNATKGSSSSSVELILAACEPSLLHISPILAELGIRRLEHLRAVNRLSEETRDKEVKEQALKKGVTVMEWAILLDKLRTL